MTDLGGDVDRVLADGLARLMESVARHTAVLARAREMTPTDLRALELVQRNGSLRPGELARALGISSSGTSGVVRRLVAAGLLCRDAGPANHREVRVRTAGGEVDQPCVAPAGQVRAACEALALNPSEREVIASFVLRLVELVEAEAAAMRAAATRINVRVPRPPRWS